MRAKFITVTSVLALACAGLATSASAVGNHGGQGSPGASAFMGSHNSGAGRAMGPGNGGGGRAMMQSGRAGNGAMASRNNRGDARARVDNDRHVSGSWNGDRDHDGDRRHRRGVYLSFGNGYYGDSYYGGGNGGCSYAYRRWQQTGSAYWYNRYADCIG